MSKKDNFVETNRILNHYHIIGDKKIRLFVTPLLLLLLLASLLWSIGQIPISYAPYWAEIERGLDAKQRWVVGSGVYMGREYWKNILRRYLNKCSIWYRKWIWMEPLGVPYSHTTLYYYNKRYNWNSTNLGSKDIVLACGGWTTTSKI